MSESNARAIPTSIAAGRVWRPSVFTTHAVVVSQAAPLVRC